MTELRWMFRLFDELSTLELFHVMKLRVDVFVVEQACCYAELDYLDTQAGTVHLLGYTDETLIAYARAFVPEGETSVVRIGRVVTLPAYRGQGVARELMQVMLKNAGDRWPGCTVGLSAQTQVLAFYESLGFDRVSDEYLEDGIPHIDMEQVSSNGVLGS